MPLPDGRILIVAGRSHDGYPLAMTEEGVNEAVSTSEIYDPASETFLPGPDLPHPREEEVQVFALADGSILLLGGNQLEDITDDSTRLLSPLLLRPGANEWSELPEPPLRFTRAVGAPLPDGGFLVAGQLAEEGEADQESGTVRWSSADEAWFEEPAPRIPAADATLVALPDGSLYLVGRLEDAQGAGLLGVERWETAPGATVSGST